MKPLKHLGQNFLNSKQITERIVAASNPKDNTICLEIGPGKGALTFMLSQKVKTLICVEKDPRLCQFLNTEISQRKISNITIINADILDFDVESLKTEKYDITGSLPFNVSKKIIKKFIQDEKIRPQQMTFVIQKDVAENYTAESPRSTYLSNYARLFSDCEILFNITAANFNPVPKVDSSVIQFVLKPPRKHSSQKSKFLKQIFGQPRKTARNNLRGMIHRKQWQSAHEKFAGIVNLDKRPAELTLNQLESLFMMYNTIREDTS